MRQWFRIYADDGKVVIDIFPHEPGGCAAYLDAETAAWLAKQLIDTAEKVRRDFGQRTD